MTDMAILDDAGNRRAFADRFWSKVERASGADCWQWLGSTNGVGYGKLWIKSNGQNIFVQAHRLAWMLCRGSIPDGLCVLHHCDNPGCCNPAHLFVDTLKGNTKDMMDKGRNRNPKGEENGQAKLTWSQVCLIRLGCFVGGTQGAMAKRYGVSSGRISEIVHGKIWRETPDQQQFLAAMYASLEQEGPLK